jgi:hypothetical protein
MGIALVLAVMVAWAGVALTKVEATAPVTARAMTRLRTMTFMMYSLFGYSEWAELNFSLDTPDATTLGCLDSQVYENHLHNRILYELGY